MTTQKKIDQVAEIRETLENSSAMWLVDYRGLTVKKSEELRRALRATEAASMKVYKNTLVKIALKELGLPTMDEYLHGTNAFVFAKGDDIAVSAKALKDFINKDPKNPAITIVGGIVDGQVMSAEQVMAIADLPSREELIAKLLGTISNPMVKIVRVLNEPMACFARAVKAIADKNAA